MHSFEAVTIGRLDVFLAQEMGISRVRAGQLVRDGCVTVNGRVTMKPAHVLQGGETVESAEDGVPVSETHIEPVDLHLEVLYEDDDCLAINKPAGFAVHPAPGIKQGESTVLHGVAFLFAQRKIPFVASHVLVHRLDRETTGCMLIAKSPEAHKALQEQFQDRSIKKSYLAVVAGVPTNASAVIDAPIGRSTIHRTKMSVHHAGGARDAKTTYRILDQNGRVSLLECDLHTGRTHQLRVHLTTIGHPILGDVTYNSRESQKRGAELHVENLCLHAWKLSFNSRAGERISIEAPLSETFETVLTRLQMQL